MANLIKVGALWINTDQITCLRPQGQKGDKTVIVFVGGQQVLVNADTDELARDLVRAGA